MIEQLLENIIWKFSYFQLFVLTLVYFLILYFFLAPVFKFVCKFLYKKKILNKIADKEIGNRQVAFEIKQSLKSILIFGFSGIPVVYLIRHDVIQLLPNTFLNVIIGLTILNLWNELHFFIIHRVMHLSFFMRNVHYVHHKSKLPTVYSVYSFHWFEALLLSTVPLTIAPLINFSPLAIFLYPLTSILFNYAGHCNYRFGNGTGPGWAIFSTRHTEHHFKVRKNFGFALNYLDQFYSFITRKNQTKNR